MKLSSWGQYPRIDSSVIKPLNTLQIENALENAPEGSIIPRGLGRSYGDSALADHVLDLTSMDHFIGFDEDKGTLTCEAGVSLAEILDTFVPVGWFLPVTPGTKFVTVGGAIASDVHGKNHHVQGCFSDHVIEIKIFTISSGLVICSREINSELFYASCGGMGLTGIIVEATFKLIPVKSSLINETTIKAKNLEEALKLFETYRRTTYSVAWIDCLSTGNALGRSLLMIGEHADAGELKSGKSGKLAIPFDMPGFFLNQYSVQAFNFLYYNRVRQKASERLVHYEPFFYPLDGIHQWNRLYGKNGFTQYQFVLPRAAGLEGMSTVLKRIADSKRGSFLAVLKVFGADNRNYLSFPMEGYTLALDFKLDQGLFDLLDELDEIVRDYGGRVYLTKDVRMSEAMFKQSYPDWEKFMAVRKQYRADQFIHSLQSQRIGL